MKHKHAELIKMWLDGEELEYNTGHTRYWWTVSNLECFTRDFEFRIKHAVPKPDIKPEPKPDIVLLTKCSLKETEHGLEICVSKDGWVNNVKATFDGETHKLKSMEVIR